MYDSETENQRSETKGMPEESIDELVDLLKAYNTAYRQGAPIVSDAEYDTLVEQLRAMAPEHPFLHTVEARTVYRPPAGAPSPHRCSRSRRHTAANNWNGLFPV